MIFAVTQSRIKATNDEHANIALYTIAIPPLRNGGKIIPPKCLTYVLISYQNHFQSISIKKRKAV